MNDALLPDSSPESDSSQSANWVLLVDRIRQGDPNAMQDLYQVFGRGVRIYLCRQLGVQDLDDKVHDTFLIVVQAIRNGELREPERLMGFVRTIARRLVAAHIDQAVHRRRDHMSVDAGITVTDSGVTPEEKVIDREKVDIMLEVLREMSPRDRDVLTRFYLYEQSQEVICKEMKLSATQFRLLKSRAKARFADAGKKKVEKRNLLRTFMSFMH